MDIFLKIINLKNINLKNINNCRDSSMLHSPPSPLASPRRTKPLGFKPVWRDGVATFNVFNILAIL